MIKIKNEAGKGIIYIYGVIVDDTDANLMLDEDGNALGFNFPTQIKNELDALKGLPVEVRIASDGGNVAAAVAIFNLLKEHDAPVDVYIDSWAASSASLVAFAGRKIYMYENTFLMIHPPAAGGYGESAYLRSIADWLDKLEDMIANTYAEHTTKSVDEIKSMMSKETWLTAKEAAEIFDVVEVLEPNEIKAVAEFKSAYKSAPKNLLPKTQEEIDAEAKAHEQAEEEAKLKAEAEAKAKAEAEIKNKISKVLWEALNHEEKG